MQEDSGIEHVATLTGWTNVAVSEEPFNSKYSPYPHLFFYWNADDNTSPIHLICTGLAISVFIGGPARGWLHFLQIFTVARLRRAMVVAHYQPSPWTMEIGVQEIVETLAFYQTTSYRMINELRAHKVKKMLSKMLHEILHPTTTQNN